MNKLCGLIENFVKNQRHHSDEQIMWLDRKFCEKPKPQRHHSDEQIMWLDRKFCEKPKAPAPVVQWLARWTVGRIMWLDSSNPIRVMWDFSAQRPAPTQSWECYGPSGKAGTTQPSFIHFTDASLRVLL